MFPGHHFPSPRFGTVYLHTSRSLPAIVKFLMWVSSFWHPASRILGDERAELTKKFKTIWICPAIKRRLCFLGCRIIAATVPDKWSQRWSRLGAPHSLGLVIKKPTPGSWQHLANRICFCINSRKGKTWKSCPGIPNGKRFRFLIELSMESFDVDVGAIKRGFMLLLAASPKQNSPRFVRAVNKLKRIQLAAECLQARAGEWERQWAREREWEWEWQWDWGMEWRNASQRQTNKQATKRADRAGRMWTRTCYWQTKDKQIQRPWHPSVNCVHLLLLLLVQLLQLSMAPQGTAQAWSCCPGSAMGITTVIGVISCLF